MRKSVSSFVAGLIALLLIPTLLASPAQATNTYQRVYSYGGANYWDDIDNDRGTNSYVVGASMEAPRWRAASPMPACRALDGWALTEGGAAVSFPYTPDTQAEDTFTLWPRLISGPCPTTPGSTPNSLVATIPAGLTGGIIGATASLPSIKLGFAATSGASVVTVAPVSNPAASSSTPFTVSVSTKIVDISVTGLTGNVTVCLDGGPTDNLYHFTGGAWVALPERSYANGQVCGVTSSFSPFAAAAPVAAAPVASVNSPAPVVDNSAALAAAELAARTVSAKKKYSAKSLARQVGVKTVSPKAAVSISVAKSSKKVCTKSGSSLKTLTAGNCVVTITVQEPKPKGGKKPKATKTVKSLVVK